MVELSSIDVVEMQDQTRATIGYSTADCGYGKYLCIYKCVWVLYRMSWHGFEVKESERERESKRGHRTHTVAKHTSRCMAVKVLPPFKRTSLTQV